jgi:hypothetical protein
MRLSSLKAARVVVGKSRVAGNPGRPIFFGPGTLWRTWGTRPYPRYPSDYGPAHTLDIRQIKDTRPVTNALFDLFAAGRDGEA